MRTAAKQETLAHFWIGESHLEAVVLAYEQTYSKQTHTALPYRTHHKPSALYLQETSCQSYDQNTMLLVTIQTPNKKGCRIQYYYYYSTVGIATCYELDGPGIDSLLGRDFQHRTGPRAYPASCTIGHSKG
jgi:hypothetical protein